MHSEAVEAVLDAFTEMGLRASLASSNDAVDVVLHGPSGVLPIEVKAMSLADRGRVEQQLRRYQQLGGRAPSDGLLIVVADEVPDSARELIRSQGHGYLDRRGAMWLRAEGVVINDTTLGPLTRGGAPASSPIRGRVGLGVALHLLMHPHAQHSVRELARAVRASPSTTHEAYRRLREHALVTEDGQPLVPELFNAVAPEWRPQRIPIARQPNPGDSDLGLRGADDGEGWVVGGNVAAAALGVRIVVSSGTPPDFYVPTAGLVRRAVRRLEETAYEQRAASVALTPSPVVTDENFYIGSHHTPWLEWPIAHPVVVALDLAQDASRGRELLEDWTPQGFDRVW